MESGENPDVQNVFWVDLVSPSIEEMRQVEHDFNVELFTKQESEEIESSSKYAETEDEIGINMNFLVPEDGNFAIDPVSFILKDKILFTQRNRDLHTFTETNHRHDLIEVQFRVAGLFLADERAQLAEHGAGAMIVLHDVMSDCLI